MKMLHVVLSVLLFMAANGVAVAADFKDIFTNGKASGDLTLFNSYTDFKSGNDAGFTMGSIGLTYETAPFEGVVATLGFRGSHDFREEQDGDYLDNIGRYGEQDEKAILHTANLSYANDYLKIIAGRQQFEQVWACDYHEGLLLSLTPVEDLTITLAHSQRWAVVYEDEALTPYEKTLGDDGLNIVDVKYEGVEGLLLEGYYYNAEDVADWYGLLAEYSFGDYGFMAHYAASSGDDGSEDGSVLQFKAQAAIAGTLASFGYLKTDEETGVGSMAVLCKDQISPLAGGLMLTEPDVQMMYAMLEYEIGNLMLGTIYAMTDYDGNKSETEFNVEAMYAITESLFVRGEVAMINADESEYDLTRYGMTLSYRF